MDHEHAHIRYFVFRLRRYVYDDDTSQFTPDAIYVGDTLGDFLSLKAGRTMDEAKDRYLLLGGNTLDIPAPSYIRNIYQEFSKTFYTYQLFIIWAWCPLYSYFMAIVQATIIVIGGLTVSYFLYRNETNTYRLTKITGESHVIRDGSLQSQSIRHLVPGDVVKISTGRVPADMILAEGYEIIVDESTLTGESIPMVKKSIHQSDAHSRYNLVTHKRHTLSAGTIVTETTNNAYPLVLKTGSYTTEGMLLRQSLSLKSFAFEFVYEVKIVVLILIAYALFGFTLIIYLYQDWFAYKFFYGMYVNVYKIVV